MKGYISDEFVDLVTRMLMPNPDDRITISEILDHSWVQGPTMSDLEAIQYLQARSQSKSK